MPGKLPPPLLPPSLAGTGAPPPALPPMPAPADDATAKEEAELEPEVEVEVVDDGAPEDYNSSDSDNEDEPKVLGRFRESSMPMDTRIREQADACVVDANAALDNLAREREQAMRDAVTNQMLTSFHTNGAPAHPRATRLLGRAVRN